MRRRALFLLFTAGAVSPLLRAQDPMAPREPGKPEGEKFFGRKDAPPGKTRSVSGRVTDKRDEAKPGAVVQLKDLKTLEVRSFIALEDGTYRFQGLSTESDYELRATHESGSSKTRRLTVFDTRKEARINLQIEPKG
jgi:hypothetical protein